VRSDLSPKPAYDALDRLINRLWRTDAAGRTDEDGRVAARAFFGRYRITARADRRTASVEVNFGPTGPAQVEVTLPARVGSKGDVNAENAETAEGGLNDNARTAAVPLFFPFSASSALSALR
jgi:hypothetical protein